MPQKYFINAAMNELFTNVLLIANVLYFILFYWVHFETGNGERVSCGIQPG